MPPAGGRCASRSRQVSPLAARVTRYTAIVRVREHRARSGDSNPRRSSRSVYNLLCRSYGASSMRAVILGVLIAAIACSSRNVLAEESAADLYQTHCAQCHGAQLQGAQGPSLRQEGDPRLDNESVLARIVREGLPEKGMPAWNSKFSDSEIAGLVQFIKEQRDENSAEHLRLVDQKAISSLPRGRVRTELHSFKVELVAEPDKPTGLAMLPDGRLLITQEHGGLRIVEGSHLLADSINGVPSCQPADVFHRVLLGVALHPHYRQNGWIYLTCGDTVTTTQARELPKSC
jgi:cytochrome c5